MTDQILARHAPGYHFLADRATGMTFRWGTSEDTDPRMAPWPELVDISVTNRCSKGCATCYRESGPTGTHMSDDDWASLLRQLVHATWGPVFQVALGGGEPTMHPALPRMLADCRENGIVPNLTTNGCNLAPDVLRSVAAHAGAVAVSWPDGKPDVAATQALRVLLAAGVRKVNIHFLLCRSTVSNALDLLSGKHDEELAGVNAVIFLTVKPKGRCPRSEMLDCASGEFAELIQLLRRPRCRTGIGVDPCLAPALIERTDLDLRFLDTCEGAFFSLFIDEHLVARPCSFGDDRSAFSLREHSLETIWTDLFEEHRRQVELSAGPCVGCRAGDGCRGTCAFFPDLYECRGRRPSALSRNPLS